MQLLTIQDPRDNLEKARRSELVKFAQGHRISDIDPAMPAILIRRILRNKGLVDIDVPVRPLGQIAGARGSARPSTPENTVEMLADDDLMQQWRRQNAPVAAPELATPTVLAAPHANGHAHDYPNEVDRMREEAECAIREGQATLLRLQAEQELISELLPGETQDPAPEAGTASVPTVAEVNDRIRQIPEPLAPPTVEQVVALADDCIRQKVEQHKPNGSWTNEVDLPSGVQDLEIDSMKMTELRKACKAAGIKMKRTDKMLDLRAKLHGENTSECSQ